MSENYNILGVDAAWTTGQPSGVSLLSCRVGEKPKLIKAGRSYQEFMADTIVWNQKLTGAPPALDILAGYCSSIGFPIQVVALDIPLALVPVTGYREADRAITKKYSRKGAAVHSPTPDRPGVIASMIFDQLTGCGFSLATHQRLASSPSFIEVYPHAAIIELFRYDYRFPYKVHKKGKYWKGFSREEQYQRMIQNLNELKSNTDLLIENTLFSALQPDQKYSMNYLKGYEDLLDSLIAAISGVYYFQGKSISYGDEEAGIWVPEP